MQQVDLPAVVGGADHHLLPDRGAVLQPGLLGLVEDQPHALQGVELLLTMQAVLHLGTGQIVQRHGEALGLHRGGRGVGGGGAEVLHHLDEQGLAGLAQVVDLARQGLVGLGDALEGGALVGDGGGDGGDGGLGLGHDVLLGGDGGGGGGDGGGGLGLGHGDLLGGLAGGVGGEFESLAELGAEQLHELLGGEVLEACALEDKDLLFVEQATIDLHGVSRHSSHGGMTMTVLMP